jgi:hypothetical protein
MRHMQLNLSGVSFVLEHPKRSDPQLQAEEATGWCFIEAIVLYLKECDHAI